MRYYTLEVLVNPVEDGSGESWPGDEVIGVVLEEVLAPLAYPSCGFLAVELDCCFSLVSFEVGEAC